MTRLVKSADRATCPAGSATGAGVNTDALGKENPLSGDEYPIIQVRVPEIVTTFLTL